MRRLVFGAANDQHEHLADAVSTALAQTADTVAVANTTSLCLTARIGVLFCCLVRSNAL
jgi:hypothetical protein